MAQKTLQELFNLLYDDTTGGLKISGTVTGDMTITGDLSVTGTFDVGAVVADSFIIDGTSTEVFLVRKDGDTGDVLAVNTTSAQLLLTADTNDGTTKILRVLDSDAAEVFSVDSDGDIIANTITLGGATSTGDITIVKTTDDAVGATLTFFKDSASPAAEDDIMVMTFDANDDLGARRNYGRFTAEIKDPDNTDLDGKIKFEILGGGTLREAFNIQGDVTSSIIEFKQATNFKAVLNMSDNINFTFGNSGDYVMNFSTTQTNDMFRFGSDSGSKVHLFDSGSTTNDFEIPNQTTNTIAIASGITDDPDVTNNVWSSISYVSGNMVLSGAPQFGTSGTVPAVRNNGVIVNPQEMTVAGTSDFAFSVIRNLNDAGAAGGSDYFSLYEGNITKTGPTTADGWDDVNFITMRVDGSKKAVLTSAGKLGLGQGVPTAFVDVLELASTGTPQAVLITGAAHTALTADTQVIGVNFDLSATKTWAAGTTLASQSEFLIQAPTYVGDAGGAMTMTEAATFAIDGAPTAGANMTITNPYTLWIKSGMTRLDGKLTVQDDNAPTTDTITVNHGSDGNPDTTGTNAIDLTGTYSGNVSASVNTSTVKSLGLTTAGNIAVANSATVINSASDAANTYQLGYMVDFTDNGGSGTSAAFNALYTSGTWDASFVSVAGDCIVTAFPVAPGDGHDVYITGGVSLTGGSAQAGGDVILGGGAGTGGGENGFVKIASGLIVPTEAVTANVDTDSEAMYFGCDTVGADTIEIQTEDIIDGRVFIIKDEGGNAAAQNITITTEGAETIDGAASEAITADYDSRTLIARNGNLFII
jgi:hypothetical protein